MTLGDWLGIVSIAVSTVGFLLTIYQVKKARTSAEAAKIAATNARISLITATSIGDCVVALFMMDEIRQHNRDCNWKALPALYSNLRRKIVAIRTHNDTLTEEQRTSVQAALSHLRTMETSAEKALADGNHVPNVVATNRILSEQIDCIAGILTAMQRHI